MPQTWAQAEASLFKFLCRSSELQSLEAAHAMQLQQHEAAYAMQLQQQLHSLQLDRAISSPERHRRSKDEFISPTTPGLFSPTLTGSPTAHLPQQHAPQLYPTSVRD